MLQSSSVWGHMTCWSSRWASEWGDGTAVGARQPGLQLPSTGMFPHNQLYKSKDPASSSGCVDARRPPAERHSNNHSIKSHAEAPVTPTHDPDESCVIRRAAWRQTKPQTLAETEWVWLIWLLIGVLAISVSHGNQRSEHDNTNRTQNTISSCNAKTQQLHNDLWQAHWNKNPSQTYIFHNTFYSIKDSSFLIVHWNVKIPLQ